MKKVIVNCLIGNSEQNSVILDANAYIDNNILYYRDNEGKVSLTLGDRVCINKEAREYIINIVFEENRSTIGKYTLINEELDLDLNVNTKKIIRKENSIVINYELFYEKDIVEDIIYKVDWR